MFLNLLAAVFVPTTLSHQFWLVLLSSLSLLAGSVVHTIARTYKDSSGTTQSHSETVTGNEEINFDQLVPIAANTNYVLKITRSQLKSLMIQSDQNISIFTNAASGGGPTDTIVLLANQLYSWSLIQDTLSAGLGKVACPITADITAGIWVTNAAGAAANLKIRAVLGA